MLFKECPRKKNQPTLSNVKSQSTIKSACFCCLITQLQCNAQLWFSHGVQKACNCEQVPMTTWKNSPASKGLVLLINTPAYSYRFVLSAWYKSLCTKKPLALTAVYLNYRGNYKQIPSTRGPKFNLQSGGMIFDNRLFCGCKTMLLLGLNMNYTAINISKEFKIFRICTKNDFWYDPFPTSPRWYRCIFPFYRTQVFHTLMILYCIPFLLKTS